MVQEYTYGGEKRHVPIALLSGGAGHWRNWVVMEIQTSIHSSHSLAQRRGIKPHDNTREGAYRCTSHPPSSSFGDNSVYAPCTVEMTLGFPVAPTARVDILTEYCKIENGERIAIRYSHRSRKTHGHHEGRENSRAHAVGSRWLYFHLRARKSIQEVFTKNITIDHMRCAGHFDMEGDVISRECWSSLIPWYQGIVQVSRRKTG